MRKTILKRSVACLLSLVLLAVLLPSCGAKSPAEGLTPRSLTWGVGGALPTAADFFETLPEGCTARYAESYSYQQLGEYRHRVLVTDERGHEAAYEVRLTLVLDEEPPVITGAKDLSILLGEGVAYRAGVSVSDNCDGEVTLTVHSSQADPTTVGTYPITYTARDTAGNETSVTVTLYVHGRTIDEGELYASLDTVIAQIITPGMTREAQLRAVHKYVYDHISYASSSDKSDWVREAYNALFVTGRGDCFSYFAACKAFLTRLGIEHKDIQRTPGIVSETHFWQLVNVGTAESPLWYHFDATHLIDHPGYSGCLLTDAQIAQYNATRFASDGVTNNYFYAYDASAYPKSATTVITAQ